MSRLSLRPGERLPMILEPRALPAHATVAKGDDRLAAAEGCPVHHG